jgi:hypothetical protein
MEAKSLAEKAAYTAGFSARLRAGLRVRSERPLILRERTCREYPAQKGQGDEQADAGADQAQSMCCIAAERPGAPRTQPTASTKPWPMPLA